ncbi:MAG: Phage tail assembly chaperone protein [Thermoanaerobacteraceae bacterium]|jgi:hypothetical protein|nr:Phage tail assembly chaperone protein [Thermoanaerobacteraceae bacterium]
MKQSVTIELDRPRSLRYGMNALVKIEEMIGRPISKLDLENISIKSRGRPSRGAIPCRGRGIGACRCNRDCLHSPEFL